MNLLYLLFATTPKHLMRVAHCFSLVTFSGSIPIPVSNVLSVWYEKKIYNGGTSGAFYVHILYGQPYIQE